VGCIILGYLGSFGILVVMVILMSLVLGVYIFGWVGILVMCLH